MSDDLVIKDPEVAEVLRKIAGDPSSGLLRIPEERITRWVTNREREVTVGEPFLTRAERYLVQEHREEVANLLMQACQQALLALPAWETMLHRSVSPGVKLTAPSLVGWKADARGALNRELAGEGAESALQLLRQCVASIGSFPSPSRLAAASLRLAPTDGRRIWLSIAFNAKTHLKSSIAVLQSILAGWPSSHTASFAHENLGFLLSLRDFTDAALTQYRAASMTPAERTSPALAWLHCSLQLGQERQALEAASFLRDHEGLEPDAVSEHVSMWTERRRREKFLPSTKARSLARTMAETVSTSSQKACRVFL